MCVCVCVCACVHDRHIPDYHVEYTSWTCVRDMQPSSV